MDPVAAAARLVGMRGRVLLHSGRDDDGLGQASFVSAEPYATLIARGHSLVELDAEGRPARRFTANPFEAAEEFLAAHGCVLDAPFEAEPVPHVIGFFGYDLARLVEKLPGGPERGRDSADLWLGAYGAVARWQAGHELEVVGADADPRTPVAHRLLRLPTPAPPPRLAPPVPGDHAAPHKPA